MVKVEVPLRVDVLLTAVPAVRLEPAVVVVNVVPSMPDPASCGITPAWVVVDVVAPLANDSSYSHQGSPIRET
jgi:hypothetical protein